MTGIGLFLTATVVLLPAHNTPDGVILRAVQVVVRPDVIEIRYQLGLHDNMIRRELQALSGPGVDVPADPAEAVARYRDAVAPLLPKKMRVTLDGQAITPTVFRADIVRQPHRQLEIAYHIPFTPALTPVKFVLWDDNFQGVPGYHFAALRARGEAQVLPVGGELPLDRLPSVPEPGQTGTVPMEPMRGVAAYVCLRGAAAPQPDGFPPPPPPVGAEQSRVASAVAKPADIRTAPVAETAGQPTGEPWQRQVLWSLAWTALAVLIAFAWWWTSHNSGKEKA